MHITQLVKTLKPESLLLSVTMVISVLIMHVCVAAVREHLPCFHFLLIHAGGGGPAPVHHSQIQGAALCLQSTGEPLGEHVSTAGLHKS